MRDAHYSLRNTWLRRVAAVLIVAGMASTVFFGLRTYSSYLLLRSATESGAPATSSIRAWMTLDYIAGRYSIPQQELKTRLGLAASTSSETTLVTLAEEAHVTRFVLIQKVQKAIAQSAPVEPQPTASNGSDWLSRIGDAVLAALLVYGYPVLAATLFFGAIGLPVPTAFAVIVAGSLSSMGHMSLSAAGVLAMVCSVLGDGVAYRLGRGISLDFLQRRGWWIGYTPERHERGRQFFERWGAMAILASRTLVSHLSSIVSLLAGSSRYSLGRFIAVATAGRVLWTSAYLAIGFLIGGHVEAAAEFLANLSMLLLSVILFAGATVFVRIAPFDDGR